ncbi:hypothetical protein [Nocardioides sp. KR10-350]|uniref:hypothetical protein n=1 Tax=Nocardioides cheoyonin TaxID=3156615 RepID=UPI0032B540B9
MNDQQGPTGAPNPNPMTGTNQAPMGAQTGQAPWGPPAGWMPPPPPRKRSRRLVVSLVAVAVLVIGAVGATSVVVVKNHQAKVDAQHRKEAAERRAAAAAKKKRQEKAAALAAARRDYQACTSQLSSLQDALSGIDARLDVGLREAEMSDLVGEASVAYSKIDVDALGTGVCLNAGAKLETSFNRYVAAEQQWNDCISDLYCDTDSIEPDLQAKWLKASTALDRAGDLLDSLNPDDPSYAPDTTASGTT